MHDDDNRFSVFWDACVIYLCTEFMTESEMMINPDIMRNITGLPLILPDMGECWIFE